MIAKAAAAVQASDFEVVLLLEDHRYMIDKDGTTVSTDRRVYRIATADAIEDWASIEQEWEPWHEVKPELRARVISPGGEVHWLDAKTIADAPAAQFDQSIFTDSRVVRAPLPAVSIGSVVEYEIVRRETAPFFSAGVVSELRVGVGVPVERFHVSMDAVKGILLRTGGNLLPVSAITETQSKSGTHVEVEVGRTDPGKNLEYSLPYDQSQTPSFRFSTGESWQAVAATYQKIITQQISSNTGKPLLSEMGLDGLSGSAGTREVVERLTAKVHERVRYTGVEFGQTTIIPNQPREVIQRHYGDCKDKAALLVALLRSAGLDAHIAVLLAGESTDVDPALPGFGMFNHAIVYVAGNQPLWIDATAENTRVGVLPLGDQGREALIVDNSTTRLTKTPESSAADNRIVHTVKVKLSESGKGSIDESLDAFGEFESQMRSAYGGDDKQTRTSLERFAKTSFNGTSLGSFRVTRKGDFSQPFSLTMEVNQSAAALTELQAAYARVSNSFLFEALPFALVRSQENDAAEQKPREHDFVMDMPYQAEVRFLIYPPPGFNLNRLPPAVTSATPASSYSFESKRKEDGTIELVFKFQMAKRRLTPAEFRILKQDLAKRRNDSEAVVAFTYKAAELMALGKTADAMRMVSEGATAHADNALAQMRFASFLMNGADGEASVMVAKKAVEQDPKSARAWFTLGSAYEHDSFGRFRKGDWKPAEAEKALRKAVELDDADLEARLELAILLEYDSAGERYGKSARVADAVKMYQAMVTKAPNVVISQNMTYALMHLGRYPEAQAESKKLVGQPAYDVLSLALTALTEGADTAILSSQTAYVEPDARGRELASAALLLDQVREYGASEQLLRAAQRLNNDPQFGRLLSLLGKTKRFEKVLLPDDDPRSPVQRFLIMAAQESAGVADMAGIISKDADLENWRRRAEHTDAQLNIFRASSSSYMWTGDMLADLVLSHTKIVLADDQAGEKSLAPHSSGAGKTVRVFTSPTSSNNPMSVVTVTSEINLGVVTFFVVNENGKCKLLGTGDGLESIGRMALNALAKGDLATAQRWLDGVKNQALPETPRDDKGPAFRYLWSGVAPETRSVIFAKASAASLVGTYSGARDAVALLRQTLEHPAQYMERDDVSFALCEALQKAKNWQELRVASQPLLNSKSYKEAGLRFAGRALMSMQLWSELGKLAAARLAISPKDDGALQFAGISAMARGDFEAAGTFLGRSKNSSYMVPIADKVLEAWRAILANKVNDQIVGDMEGTNPMALFYEGSAYSYTLALTQLRNGKPEDCARTLMLGLEMDQYQPSSLAWLVQGEMMKQYSLKSEVDLAFEHARTTADFDGLEFAQLLLVSAPNEQARP